MIKDITLVGFIREILKFLLIMAQVWVAMGILLWFKFDFSVIKPNEVWNILAIIGVAIIIVYSIIAVKYPCLDVDKK